MDNYVEKMICFVSGEIWPGNGGGIGRLLSENARLLTGSVTPVFLLDIDDMARDTFQSYAEVYIPGARIYTVDGLLASHASELRRYGDPRIGLPDFKYFHYWRSYLIDLCLQHILAVENVSGIEFADYLGQGYIYFKMRLLRESCRNIPAWVRLHGSAEICDEADGKDKFTPARLRLYDMERYCLARCDRWVAPSAAVRDWYGQYYELKKNCLTSPPGFQHLGPGQTHPRRPDPARPRRVLFYSKLQRLKGVDLLVRAALEFLRRDDSGAEFLLVGPDVPDASGASTKERLERMIPQRYRANFIFKGKIEPSELPEIAAGCDLAVIPSRFESFCLAAHELNWIGIPLLVNDIPGFADFFVDGQNCLKFEGTAINLYRRLQQFFNRPDILKRLRRRAPGPDLSVPDLYGALSSAAGLDPVIVKRPVEEPPVAIFTGGEAPSAEVAASLAALNYSNWRVWYSGEDGPPGDLSDSRLMPEEQLCQRLPDGGRRLRRENAKFDFYLFLPEQALPRPDFLNQAVAALTAEPGLAGVTCYAALDGPGPEGEEYIIPFDLNRYLIFTENVTGGLPVLWRRETVAGRRLEELVEPAAIWSFLCSLAAAGKQIAVLPRLLMDMRGREVPRFSVSIIEEHSGYVRKNATGLMRLFIFLLEETRGGNHVLRRRVAELEKVNGDLWAEVKKLGASWEELRSYTLAKEEVCTELWNDLVESRAKIEQLHCQLNEANGAAVEMRRKIEEQQAEMESLISFLEKKKLVRLLTATGLWDEKYFRRGK
ncbi:glycosyltransferase family 4 protein [Pelotomaculum propionicicum]|uniref:Glycogen synthase n=1 Tax=Pelotomaculum propionicicum TaxID=258475 RepID=A0A4Y7RLN5_9FIRM|nr:glycosyltransferase [Pelotomaculum propionicicum]TEB09721.1 Glycogen synthase [Pelotomaculum propionicicum]